MTPDPRDPSPPILKMAAPLVVSFVMRSAFTFVDTAFAATLGDPAVAAIGLAVPFEFLMIAVWVGLSTGLTSSLSRVMGADEHRKIEQYLQATWRLVLMAAPVFVLVGCGIWYGAPRVGLETEVAKSFQVYGAVLIGGSAFTAFWSVIPDSVVKAHQDTRSTMWAGICSNVVNVSLNTFFLFVLHWGIFGIALSTVLGRIGGLSYALYRARVHERRRLSRIVEPDRTEDPTPYRTILSLAVPASLTFALMATESGVINALLASLERATEAIAAYSIIYRVQMLALQPIIATTVAVLPFAARRFGLGDVEGVRSGMRQVGLATIVYSVLLVGPTMVFGGPTIARLLAEAPATARFATFGLWLVPAGCLVIAPFFLCRPVFEAMGRGTPGLIMASLRYLVLTVPLVWVGMQIARAWGYPAVYGVVVALLIVAGISSALFSFWLNRALRMKAEEAASAPPETVDGSGGGADETPVGETDATLQTDPTP